MTMPGDVAFDDGLSFFGSNLTIAVLNGSVPAWREYIVFIVRSKD